MVLEQLLRPTLITLTCAAVLLALLEWVVVCLNRRYRVGAKVNERSSHAVFNPTGGGIIWGVTAVVAAIVFGDAQSWSTWAFAGGITVLAVISFIDDIHAMPPAPRLIVQIAVVALTFVTLFDLDTIGVYLLVLLCGVGLINAINFVDGICGMLGLYGLVVSGTLLFALDAAAIPQTAWLINVMTYVIVAQAVFALFNLRDTIFAGDVGSITLGYIQAFAVVTIIIATGDVTYAVFFAVCLFDTGLTTLQRLFTPGVSILKPHRMNIYQLLTTSKQTPGGGTLHHGHNNQLTGCGLPHGHNNQLTGCGLPHLAVSGIYALTQLLINIAYFNIPPTYRLAYTLATCALLTAAYILLRRSLTTHFLPQT